MAAGLALVGGVVYSAAGATALALAAAVVAGVPALWLAARRATRPAPALSPADG